MNMIEPKTKTKNWNKLKEIQTNITQELEHILTSGIVHKLLIFTKSIYQRFSKLTKLYVLYVNLKC